MRKKLQDAESVGNAGLALVLALMGAVLVGLLTFLFWHGINAPLQALVLAAVPVAVSLTWIWSRMR